MDEITFALIKTLAFFDIFDEPLTKEEIFKYWWGASKGADALLAAPPAAVGVKDGFYFLAGREEIVEIRKARAPILEKKINIARRAVTKLRWVPFARAVFLCNNVALGTVKKDSDVDVFIIVKAGRIWLTRLLITLWLGLWRLRRHGKKITDRVCLSFYVTDDNLNLKPLVLARPDVYFMYWIASLQPLYDPDNVREKIQAENKWVLQHVPNAFKDKIKSEIKIGAADRKISRFCKSFLEKIWGGGYGDLMEAQARGLQKAKMKLNFSSAQSAADTRVIINDQTLKFHENDRRQEYLEKWRARCRALGVTV